MRLDNLPAPLTLLAAVSLYVPCSIRSHTFATCRSKSQKTRQCVFYTQAPWKSEWKAVLLGFSQRAEYWAQGRLLARALTGERAAVWQSGTVARVATAGCLPSSTAMGKPGRGEECPLGQAALGAPKHQASPQPWEEAYLSPLAKSP